MDRLSKFVSMSRYAGERFDLVQAGGGNTSVKFDDGTMLIKASGYQLSELEIGNGYVRVDNREVLKLLDQADSLPDNRRMRDDLISRQMGKTVVGDESARPSIETLLHSLLKTYTLHTHPIVVNAAACRMDWQDLLQGLFPDSVCVDYRTPGIELALELKRQLDNSRVRLPQVFFLRNHGLIVTSDDYDEIEALTEQVATTLELHFSIDFEHYRKVTTLSRMLERFGAVPVTVYLSEDATIGEIARENPSLLSATPFCPDTMVYCGVCAVSLNGLNDESVLADYCHRNNEPPRLLIAQGRIYIGARNLKKAREIEEVFKFHLLVLRLAGNKVNFLPEQELAYLGNWEAEKFRRNI